MYSNGYQELPTGYTVDLATYCSNCENFLPIHHQTVEEFKVINHLTCAYREQCRRAVNLVISGFMEDDDAR